MSLAKARLGLDAQGALDEVFQIWKRGFFDPAHHAWHAEILWAAGQTEAAEAAYWRSLEEARRANGTESPRMWSIALGYAKLLLELERPREARDLADRGDRLLREELGSDHHFRSQTLLIRGRAQLALDEVDASLRSLELALQNFDTREQAPHRRAKILEALARTGSRHPQLSRSQVRAHARAALAEFARDDRYFMPSGPRLRSLEALAGTSR